MIILVTGGTGTQGGAVARRLLGEGHEVRVLVRDSATPAARDIEARGAVLVQGSFGDGETLQEAATGVQAVFSMQPAPQSDPDSERKEARALVAAARQVGVDHFIHTSVSNTGSFRSMAGWQEGRWARNYWESKADAEAIAADAGFRHLTILRPAFMMENFIAPKANGMFPDLANGEIVTAVEPDSRIALVAADDIAATASMAIRYPDQFTDEPIELAGDWLTLPKVAEILSRSGFGDVTARTASRAELIERGQFAGWVETQEWMNVVGYPARPQAMLSRGLVPTSFAAWAQRRANSSGMNSPPRAERELFAPSGIAPRTALASLDGIRRASTTGPATGRRAAAMANDISMDESRTIMTVATNVRPDENIHHDPAFQPVPVPRGRPVTTEESKRILSLAANVRPLENVHPGDQDDENDD